LVLDIKKIIKNKKIIKTNKRGLMIELVVIRLYIVNVDIDVVDIIVIIIYIIIRFLIKVILFDYIKELNSR
jgi:hypothetical protein